MAQLSKTLESKQEPPGTPGTIFSPYQLLEPAAEAKRKKLSTKKMEPIIVVRVGGGGAVVAAAAAALAATEALDS